MIVFRIPTPVFGGGLVEGIPIAEILANINAETSQKDAWGIHGHPNAHISGTKNLSGNDGTFARFGWKAQDRMNFARRRCGGSVSVYSFFTMAARRISLLRSKLTEAEAAKRIRLSNDLAGYHQFPPIFAGLTSLDNGSEFLYHSTCLFFVHSPDLGGRNL